MKGKASRYAALLGLLLVAGCSYQVKLNYDPIVRGTEDPTTSVALKVVDAREPGLGGSDTTAIGQVRGGYGNPIPVYETDPQRVAQLVRDATTDALLHSRVGVENGGPRTLVATVKGFWVDGYVGYKATVEVQCALQDGQGQVIWTSLISGAAGGVAWWTPTGFVAGTFQDALADYAQHAMGQFSSAQFQKLLF
jgi:hypothetical protein